MKTLTVIITLIALSATGLAFDKPQPKPISKYMRDIGILYLETVGQLTLDCGKKSTADSDCMGQWESTMDGLEDRVNITLSDESHKRAPGDVQFWDLLKSTKYARKMYVIAEKDQQKAWSQAYVKCAAHAHTSALEGEYFDDDGGCGASIETATHQAQ